MNAIARMSCPVTQLLSHLSRSFYSILYADQEPTEGAGKDSSYVAKGDEHDAVRCGYHGGGEARLSPRLGTCLVAGT